MRCAAAWGAGALLALALLSGAPACAQDLAPARAPAAPDPSAAPPDPSAAPPDPSAAPAGDEGGLRVQRRWRLLAIGLDVRPELAVEPLLCATERTLRRELPGLDVRFEPGFRRFACRRDPRELDNQALVTEALAQAEAAGLPVAEVDVVFVLSPHVREYFGLSHLDYQDARGRAARAALVQSRPFEALHRGVVDALEERYPPGFYPDPREGQDLSPEARRRLAALLRFLREPLRALCELPLVSEALLAPTIAHELGHFFAPGDPEVKDGYQEPWLRHGTGPADNPEGHGVECCMQGRSASFYLEKLLATRGRLVVFCDACRRKLGLVPELVAPRHAPWF